MHDFPTLRSSDHTPVGCRCRAAGRASTAASATWSTSAASPPEAPMTESAPRWGGVDLVVAFVVAQPAPALGFGLFALAPGLPASAPDTDALPIRAVALLPVQRWLGIPGVPPVAPRPRGPGPRPDLDP